MAHYKQTEADVYTGGGGKMKPKKAKGKKTPGRGHRMANMMAEGETERDGMPPFLRKGKGKGAC